VGEVFEDRQPFNPASVTAVLFRSTSRCVDRSRAGSGLPLGQRGRRIQIRSDMDSEARPDECFRSMLLRIWFRGRALAKGKARIPPRSIDAIEEVDLNNTAVTDAGLKDWRSSKPHPREPG